MFVKKLVEKASSSKKLGGNSEGLKASEVEPRLAFHYGIPSGANMLAYDSIQKILAISTRYVGDHVGNISILKLDEETCRILQMKYTIPLSASHGNSIEASADAAVLHIIPQPMAESKRVLIVFRDGLITLWDIRESRSIFTTGGSLLHSQHNDTKKVTSACWACPFGSKVAVGYSNGEIFIWSIPATPNSRTEITPDNGTQNAPIYKLNLGYKSDKIPIASLKWIHADGKASRLYIMGASDFASTNLLQIEKYLLQSQSRGSPSLPKEIKVKMPFADSSITTAKFITDNPYMLSFGDEDYLQFSKNIPSLFPFEAKPKDGTHTNPVPFCGFSKIKNLYITGHSDGAIHFWDACCPFFIPILSFRQQSEDDFSLSGIPLTALYFDGNSRILVSGDKSGMVRIFKFKPEPYAAENSFIPFQGSLKKGNSHVIKSLKLLKVNGSVISMSISHGSELLAVGSDQGYDKLTGVQIVVMNVQVSLIDTKGPTLLYQKHIASEISTGIVSLRFQTCSLHGFEKNVLVVATKDSSVLAVDVDTGNLLSTSTVHPKKPSKAFFMQILDGQDMLAGGSNASNVPDLRGNYPAEDSTKQSSVLICSEKAVYVYSLSHVLQVNGDQEMFIVSILLQKEHFRLLDCVSQVYTKDLMPMPSREGFASGAMVPKEKKKGMFSSVIKDIKGSKPKQVSEVETEDTKESIEELAIIFSTANFASETENSNNMAMDTDGIDLDIDDIDLDDHEEKPKDQNILAALNKQKLASKFQAFTGKIKQMKVKNEKNINKEEQQDEKAGAVDQIKKKYGFSSSGETSAAKIAESKLHENVKKLQGINLKSTEMQDTAKSFSAMARELLRTAEKDKRSS
ncbi:hypothetical protein JCGZ_22396 [Jatropha curcas]|uniref:Lethal giant larvae (Lgl)-like C-terminal domain-containing protein n=1 Tax=Jatropha curcas TaxID=180498 RepID=A0A067LHV1_JATCU|nr:hypothetical protein JCGZ_22396 [Jatropha curcas]